MNDIFVEADFFETRKFLFEEQEYGNWENEEDIPDDVVYQEMEVIDSNTWINAKCEMKGFFNNGVFLLTGTAGTWRGQLRGGFIAHNYDELSKAWSASWYHTTHIYDENGMFCIDIAHHDGTNHWEVKQLTQKGIDYLSRHEYDDEETLHDKLWQSPYSKLCRFAKTVYGC